MGPAGRPATTGSESTMLSDNDIRDILEDHGALLEGHFLLASGKHSNRYLQAAMIAQHPPVLSRILRDPLRDLEQSLTIDTVLTAATGGIPVAQQVGTLLERRTIFAERDDENRLRLRRNFRIDPGEKVLLVEDVVTTGGTLEELRELVEHNGGEVVGVFTLFNRSGMSSWSSFPLHSTFEAEFPLWEPETCPLCEKDRPLVRPGTKDVEFGSA